ncbi:MAG: hypothetical protein EA391_09140 [Balneolaceae bacterium]|nr:MAG: hypothetical protein EA391_09140 [Balneolaceae bacterium]
MGKKIALGCLGVFLIVVVGGGYIGYNTLIKPIMGSVSQLQEINEKNNQIQNQASFTPPQNMELEENQVERFVNVQKSIRTGLEDRLAEFQEKYEEISEELEGRDPSIREMMGVFGDLVQLYGDAKQIQVDALNAENFSLEEYRFVQQSFYQALGVELFQFDIDAIAKAAADGNMDFNPEDFETMQQKMDEIPERNRELVAPYTENIDEWITFAWWGL